MRKAKPTIVLATWPQHSGVAYFGDREYDKWGEYSCDSVKLKFRAIDHHPDTGLYLDSDTRDAVSNLGLWVWFDQSGRLSIEARMFDIHSLTMRQMDANHRLLKWASGKMDNLSISLSSVQVPSAHLALSVVLAELGIKQAIEYRPGTDTFIKADAALVKIADHIETRWKRMNPVEVAA